MKIIKNIFQLRGMLDAYRRQNKSIGFVPTMGALHDGHLSLIRTSKREHDVTVVSIFVNPAQFGPKEDFRKYPRTLRQDAALAKKERVDVVFCPNAKAIYPHGYATAVEVPGYLTSVLCGTSRPGHFRGVATVVNILLNIVQPDAMYLGQKDAQQCVVLQHLVTDLAIPTRLVICPTVREKDGLAMSSRNAYLTPDERREALALYESLVLARKLIQKGQRNSAVILRRMRDHIQKNSSGKIDYLACVNPATLQPQKIVIAPSLLAGAVYFRRTRLIDNLIVPSYNSRRSSRKSFFPQKARR